jgi:hypothetical protein
MHHWLGKYFRETICNHRGFEYIPQYADEKLVYLFSNNVKEVQNGEKKRRQ